MKENLRHLFGKCTLLSAVLCAGLFSVAAKAGEEVPVLSERENLIIAAAAKAMVEANKKPEAPKASFLASFANKILNMDKKRALMIAVPTVAIAFCMTPSVRTFAFQGVEAAHVGLLKLWRSLPWSQEKKEALACEIEALEAANKKRGDERPEFKIKETLDNFKWSGGMVGFTVLFLECLLGEDSTKLK